MCSSAEWILPFAKCAIFGILSPKTAQSQYCSFLFELVKHINLEVSVRAPSLRIQYSVDKSLVSRLRLYDPDLKSLRLGLP